MAMPDYDNVYEDFFAPLRESEAEIVAFPGFGFWHRDYATLLANITEGAPEILLNHGELCRVIVLLFEQQYGSNNTELCPPLWDNLSCFPAIEAGQLSVIPCPQYILTTPYDTSNNATRGCSLEGIWDDKAEYGSCKPTVTSIPEATCDNSTNPYLCNDYSMLIYSIGYTLSLVTLIMALCLFMSFREIRCLRNKIHANLFFTYVLSLSAWIVTALTQTTASQGGLTASCVSFVLVRYFHMSTFFWMFTEGFYLYLQVMAPLHVEIVKLRHYLCIGWGLPLVVVGLWSCLTYFLQTSTSAVVGSISYSTEYALYEESSPLAHFNASEDLIYESHEEELPEAVVNHSAVHCPFLVEASHSEWAYKAPVLLILACNMVFLIVIMAVVICKLRSESSTERHRQHWRAAKALLVIFPLLGISYIITLVGPTEGTPGHRVFQYVRAFLLSIQGFVITLPYCFLNTEIRGIIKQHWERWRLNRGSDPYSGANRRASNRQSFSMAGYYSTATTDTRLSTHPNQGGFSVTPERIPLQNASHFGNNRHLQLPATLKNGNNNGSSHRYSPNTAGGSTASVGSPNTRNGSPRKVFVTIHENDEVTTRLVNSHSDSLPNNMQDMSTAKDSSSSLKSLN